MDAQNLYRRTEFEFEFVWLCAGPTRWRVYNQPDLPRLVLISLQWLTSTLVVGPKPTVYCIGRRMAAQSVRMISTLRGMLSQESPGENVLDYNDYYEYMDYNYNDYERQLKLS